MVEYALNLDNIFGSLADGTRRDILQRVLHQELTVNEIAAPYDISLAAVSKHLKILERARLIIKRRRGRQYLVSASPAAIRDATEYLEQYRELWEMRFDALERLLEEQQRNQEEG